jgi:hypothetical protein
MPTNDRRDCDKACKTCPFLLANFGKPNPPGYDPEKMNAERTDGGQFHDWYSLKNLRRIWAEGMRHGEVLQCHATDPNAEVYGGKRTASGSERVCVGVLAVVLRHMEFYNALLEAEPDIKPAAARRRYVAVAGKYPMSKQGMLAWALMIGMGRTDMLGGLMLPRHLDAATVEAVGVPWKDELVNQTCEETEPDGSRHEEVRE